MSAHVGPTAIGKLHAEHRSLRKQIKAGERLQEKLMAEVKQRMANPHPSITYNKENDADGLNFFLPDKDPHTLHRYIPSQDIKIALDRLEGSCADYKEADGELIIFANRKCPLSEDELARRERLLARLELSREYEKKRHKIERDIGFIRITKKLEDGLYPRVNAVESRIYATPAVTRVDLDVKLALYDTDESRNNWLAKRLLRDLRRLAKVAPLPAGAVQS